MLDLLDKILYNISDIWLVWMDTGTVYCTYCHTPHVLFHINSILSLSERYLLYLYV